MSEEKIRKRINDFEIEINSRPGSIRVTGKNGKSITIWLWQDGNTVYINSADKEELEIEHYKNDFVGIVLIRGFGDETE